MSNIASDAGYVVLIPLGAMVFRAYDEQTEDREQGNRVGQLVAHSLNAVEPAVVGADLFGRFMV